MRLNMIKGQEVSLFVENAVDSIKDNGFWRDSYTKAFDALNDYIKSTKEIRRDMKGTAKILTRSNILYRSPQNIIAFSGQRGTGKSSVMLSFSDMLSDPKKLQNFCMQYEKIKDCSAVKNNSFITLDPIDPTTMEENQSILSIVLSRLLFKAEECWNQNLNFYGNFQDKESKKTELLSAARKCLNGISTIKSKKELSNDLADLQRVGDSSILEQNLYDFVELFLQFINTHNNSETENCLLVLQIDDIDCQISQGYEVMEDIRKYFTIPNVLILMATDTKLLSQLLTQHYVRNFSVNLNYKLIETETVRQLGEKLLVKMLPPTRVVHLPYIDEIIRDKIDQLHMYYYENEEKKHNLLDFTGETTDEEHSDTANEVKSKKTSYDDYAFQSVILRYIYQKTHIVFTSHSAYANNIIPTTLRGLAHLLGLLSSMDDVPEVDFNKNPFDANYLAEIINRQIPILDKNLNLFEEYFLYDWLPAKLPKDMIEIIEKLSRQAPDQRIAFIIKELYKFYSEYYNTQNKNNGTNKSDKRIDYLSNYAKKINPTYADLDCLLRIIQGTKTNSNDTSFRRLEDFYFIFAIRTLITIKNNKDILKFKLKNIQEIKEETNIFFNYLADETSIPQTLYWDITKLRSYYLVKEKTESLNTNEAKILKYYIHNNGDINIQKEFFNFTGGVIRWLAPQEEDLANMDQLKIYKAQELATIVAANCDVQERIRKYIVYNTRNLPREDDVKIPADVIKNGLYLIQKAVAEINESMFEQYKLDSVEKLAWQISEKIINLLNQKKQLITTNNSKRNKNRKGIK